MCFFHKRQITVNVLGLNGVNAFQVVSILGDWGKELHSKSWCFPHVSLTVFPSPDMKNRQPCLISTGIPVSIQSLGAINDPRQVLVCHHFSMSVFSTLLDLSMKSSTERHDSRKDVAVVPFCSIVIFSSPWIGISRSLVSESLPESAQVSGKEVKGKTERLDFRRKELKDYSFFSLLGDQGESKRETETNETGRERT